MHRWLQQSYFVLLSILVFLIPSNLFLTFSREQAYVHGILVDYLIPKLYVSDLVIFTIFGLWLFEYLSTQKKTRSKLRVTLSLGCFIVCFLFLFARQFFSSHPYASLWYFFKILEIGSFCWFLLDHKEVLQSIKLQLSFFVSLIFQTVIGAWQFLTQHSVFPGYIFLGEPNLSQRLGLAKMTFFGQEKVLAYGTTAHPNILAGFAVFFWFFINLQKKRKPFFQVVSAICTLIILFVTQSFSAFLMFLLGSMYLSTQEKKFWHKFRTHISFITLSIFLLFPIFINILSLQFSNDTSFVRRAQLHTAAGLLFQKNPLWGTGLNAFTTQIENVFRTNEIVRFVQPVHHVGLLWLAETGVLGVCLLLAGYSLIKGKYSMFPLMFLLPIAVLDHYLLTNQTGLLLLVWWYVSFSIYQKTKNPASYQ